MYNQENENIADMAYRERIAQAYAPTDIFTRTAIILVKTLTSILIVLLPVQLVTTCAGGAS